MRQTPSERLHRQQLQPRSLMLWRALQSLQTCVSFMNTGAHPDDETTSMLTAIGLRDGISLSFACANRGEGGQNDIGTEVTQDLGVIRTAEMERAADVLNMRLYWLSQHPDDSIFDFGFSKSGEETLRNWQKSRSLQRFVEIVRTEKPDIICPTFLDVPGQHGHHRAMTQLALEVFDAAADPAFSDMPLPPWQVKKLYLPAWSGAGDSYDDDLPPPPATIEIDARGEELPSGWSWAQIAQHSRLYHQTQGMGHWVDSGSDNRWPLHLARSFKPAADQELTSGLPVTLSDWAIQIVDGANGDKPGGETPDEDTHCKEALLRAQQFCDQARSLWPHYEKVLLSASQAYQAVCTAITHCPQRLRDELLHRLEHKQQQLSRVIFLASGADVRASLDNNLLAPGNSSTLTLTLKGVDDIKGHQHIALPGPHLSISAEVQIPPTCRYQNNELTIADNAPCTDAYPDFHDPAQAALPAIAVTVAAHGVSSTTLQALTDPLLVIPSQRVELSPRNVLLNVNSDDTAQEIELAVTAVHPEGGKVDIQVPAGWRCEQSDETLMIAADNKPAPQLLTLPVLVNDKPASRVIKAHYPHINARIRAENAELHIRVVDAALPDSRIGYIGGGNDRVDYWLRALGLQVTDVDASLLNTSALQSFDTLVVGLFAARTRPDFSAALPLVHQWVNNGGHLLTLYHRPKDNWDPDNTPPRPLTIGKPSLRFRVTDENAEVTHLLPEHTLLNSPNKITAEDWSGWHKERGLYFAKSWDASYEALLSMADPDEADQHGALLSAKIGEGRHTHTSLILHHQMEKMIPGAYRLMANLVSRA